MRQWAHEPQVLLRAFLSPSVCVCVCVYEYKIPNRQGEKTWMLIVPLKIWIDQASYAKKTGEGTIILMEWHTFIVWVQFECIFVHSLLFAMNTIWKFVADSKQFKIFQYRSWALSTLCAAHIRSASFFNESSSFETPYILISYKFTCNLKVHVWTISFSLYYYYSNVESMTFSFEMCCMLIW